MKSVGQTIKFWREKTNLSRAELGRRVGVQNHRLMYLYESDKKSIPLNRLVSIADKLNAPCCEFVESYFQRTLQKYNLEENFSITVEER